MSITTKDIAEAMYSSIEGYAAYVVDSIQFNIDRDLTDEEQQNVYKTVEDAISKVTTEMEKVKGTPYSEVKAKALQDPDAMAAYLEAKREE
ncbi:TPA: hypothetical protein ACSTLU_004430 [Serratia fonticola]